MASEDTTNKRSDKGGVIAGGSILSGLAALVGASCCVLPLILVNLGVSTALVGKLAFFARAQHYFMGGAVVLLIGAVAASFWKGRRPSRRVAIMFGIAVAFILAAYIAPSFEPQILRWVNR